MKYFKLMHCFVIVACLCFIMSFSTEAKANGKFTVTSDGSSAVTVTITDAGIIGSEASVICYSPSWTGTRDIAQASKDIVYLGQKKSGQNVVTFKINAPAVAGKYTVSVGAQGAITDAKFVMVSSPNQPGNPQNPGNQPGVDTVKKPKAPKIAVKVKGKKAIVSWKKVKGVKGYKVYVSSKKKGKYKVKATVKKAKTTKCTIKLKKGKYFIKAKSYKKASGKTVYSKFSNVKKVVIKK